MERDLFDWVDVAMDIVQVVALAAILWQLFHLRGGFLVMLRVLRRMDRKMPDTKAGAYLPQAEAERAVTGSGQEPRECFAILDSSGPVSVSKPGWDERAARQSGCEASGDQDEKVSPDV